MTDTTPGLVPFCQIASKSDPLVEIEAAMTTANVPRQASEWLNRIAARYRAAIEAQLTREADEQVDRG